MCNSVLFVEYSRSRQLRQWSHLQRLPKQRWVTSWLLLPPLSIHITLCHLPSVQHSRLQLRHPFLCRRHLSVRNITLWSVYKCCSYISLSPLQRTPASTILATVSKHRCISVTVDTAAVAELTLQVLCIWLVETFRPFWNELRRLPENFCFSNWAKGFSFGIWYWVPHAGSYM